MCINFVSLTYWVTEHCCLLSYCCCWHCIPIICHSRLLCVTVIFRPAHPETWRPKNKSLHLFVSSSHVHFADDEAGIQGDSLKAARSGLGSAAGRGKGERGEFQEVWGRSFAGIMFVGCVWTPLGLLNVHLFNDSLVWVLVCPVWLFGFILARRVLSTICHFVISQQMFSDLCSLTIITYDPRYYIKNTIKDARIICNKLTSL